MGFGEELGNLLIKFYKFVAKLFLYIFSEFLKEILEKNREKKNKPIANKTETSKATGFEQVGLFSKLVFALVLIIGAIDIRAVGGTIWQILGFVLGVSFVVLVHGAIDNHQFVSNNRWALLLIFPFSLLIVFGIPILILAEGVSILMYANKLAGSSYGVVPTSSTLVLCSIITAIGYLFVIAIMTYGTITVIWKSAAVWISTTFILSFISGLLYRA